MSVCLCCGLCFLLLEFYVCVSSPPLLIYLPYFEIYDVSIVSCEMKLIKYLIYSYCLFRADKCWPEARCLASSS